MRTALRFAVATGAAATGAAALVVALLGAPASGSPPEPGPPRAAPAAGIAVPAAPSSPNPVPPTGPARSDPAPSSGTFTPGRYDVNAQVKQAAAEFVARVGTWRSSEPDEPAARLTAAGYPAELMAMAAPLLDTPAPEATTTVVYPQYGGLTDRAASVMVLARQELHIDSGDRVRDVLLDVRMARTADGTWQVTSTVDPPRPQIAAPRAGGPSPLGRTVLEDPAIRIPEPGRADVTDRRADDPILAVLARLADSYTLDVQVIVSGHPGTVFPSTHLSNHAVGRAFDVRAVDGRPVSSIPRDDPLLAEFMIAAGRAGATEVGGPIAPSGRGFFSDAVHQDHFHLGITPTESPAAPAGRSG